MTETKLKDVLNSVSQINCLLTNVFERLSKVENHLNNVERRLKNLKNLENKVIDLEDSQDFLFGKYELQNQKIERIQQKNQQLTKENLFLLESLKVFETKSDEGRQKRFASEQYRRREMVEVSGIKTFE